MKTFLKNKFQKKIIIVFLSISVVILLAIYFSLKYKSENKKKEFRKVAEILLAVAEELRRTDNQSRVELMVGESSVIKFDEGYLFIILNQIDFVNDTSTCSVFYSKSGKFKTEKEKISTITGKSGTYFVNFLEHQIDLWCKRRGNKNLCTVRLDINDKAAIAKFSGNDPNQVNISELQFFENPTFDPNEVKKSILEKYETKPHEN